MWTLATTIICSALLGYALAWAQDRLQRKAFEGTLTETERAQFNVYRLVLPWRSFANVVKLDRAEALSRLIDRQRDLGVRREAIRASKAIQDNFVIGDISSLTDRVRALQEDKSARAA
jgi:hypothetical protein